MAESPDGEPTLALLDQPSPHHIVQFYDDDTTLIDNIARFAIAGLARGQPVVVIAGARRRDALAARLGRDAIDPCGRLMTLDAADLLAIVMDGETPSADRFRTLMTDLIERAAGSSRAPVRIYSEIVDLVCARGDRDAAVRLEASWNDLARSHGCSQLCAYAMAHFARAADAAPFERVCQAHSHIIPAETYHAEARDRQLAVLQQRARALDAELAQREHVEAALHDALARDADARATAERGRRYHELFTGLLGHDLRNPLGAVMMLADYIARLNLGDTPTRNASRIAASALRMSRMIDQLLDFTQIWIGGGLALDPTPIDLAELCDRVKDDLEADHLHCAIAIEATGDTSGRWDRHGLVRVFANLLGNAITHGSDAGLVTVRIDGTAATDVVVHVHNAGAISPSIVAALFEPSWGSKPRHKAHGLGLGLFITRQIVVAHAGTISAVSNAADGTTLAVTLPRAALAGPRG